MKKILLSVFAVAALASCVQTETINPLKAISFGDAYVSNSTKAIYGNQGEEGVQLVDAFQVWGTMTTEEDVTVTLYEGANVIRDGKAYGVAWTCDATRFWTPDCEYAFYAVVDGRVAKVAGTSANANVTVANGVPTKIAYEADGQNDLLYGATTKSTQGGLAEPDPALVAFTMEHLLSLVKVSFINSVNTSDNAYTYKITDVNVATWSDGAYDIATKTWAAKDGSTNKTLAFEEINSLAYATTATPVGAQLIIPDQPIDISFTYEEKLNGSSYITKNVSKTVVATAKKGYLYNITVEFQKNNEIKFTIDSVDGYTTDTENGGVTIQ